MLLEAADLFGVVEDEVELDVESDVNETSAIDPIIVDPEPIDSKSICPFTVVVDTREQSPYHFLNIDPFTVVPLQTTVALATGDYSIVGYESRLTVERKSISDFLGSITAGRERFEREFERMAEMIRQGGFAVVVVEGEQSEVLREAASRTKVKIDSILGTVDAWSIRYGVHFRFCVGGRRGAEIQTLKILYQFWRQDQKKKSEALKELKEQAAKTSADTAKQKLLIPA